MTRLPILMLSLACAATRLSAQSYVGTWALVLVDKVSPDGKFASGAKATGTPDENQQAVQGNSSHFGRYSVATSDGGKSSCELEWRRVDAPSLVGTWTLTAADEIRPDGSRVNAYGASPEGQLIFDASGHYSVFVSRVTRTKFQSGEKSRGSADEYKAATLEISSHYGRYAVDEASHTITFDIVHASFPNLDGAEQKRPFELTGDELTYRLPPSADGTIALSSWRRVR